MSRNKTEGKYVGKLRGGHIRAIPKYASVPAWWAEITGEEMEWSDWSWPSTDSAWLILYNERGISTAIHKPRYESKK